jgi:polyisoprenoid-binding protein YceI
MKTFKLIPIFTLIFVLVFAIRCSDDSSSTPTPLFAVSGKVTYPDANGAAVAASGAVVSLSSSSPSVSMEAVADASGNYRFSNLEAATYSLSAIYNTDNKNNSARLDGLRFSIEDVEVVVSTAAATQDLALESPGQPATGIQAMDADYSWTGAAYENAGTWTYDATHSPIAFEFSYRGNEADFVGAFSQLNKFVVDFDPANPGAGSIDVAVDLASINTRSAGGRDNTTTTAINPLFAPTTMFTKLGCIMGTFGITGEGGETPSEATPLPITDEDARYAKFTSTSIAVYGDGYLAKGNLIFHGETVPISLMFKAVPAWLDASNNRTYSGFEGKFLMDAKGDFGINSSSLNDAIVRIQISIVLYKS